jgi:phospholipid-binding lipoprotein MlaA
VSLLRPRALAVAGLMLGSALWAPPAAAQPAQGGAAPAAEAAPTSSKDPFESLNRRVFRFNEVVDESVLKPMAQGYQRWVPEPVRTSVDNVLGNLGDVWSTANQLLQGKLGNATAMTMRVLTNTVFGVGGLFDPASLMGLDRQSEDFGQTLGRWGVPPGPYVVLPLLGPSTLRDTAGKPLDIYYSPSYVAESTAASIGISGLQVVSVRAGLLSASNMLDGIALDKYSFLRDAYLARRRSQVYDGDPPDEPETPDDSPLEPVGNTAPAPASAPAATVAEPAASAP